MHLTMNLALPEKKVTSVSFAHGTGQYPECPSLQTPLQTAKIAMSLDSKIISATTVVAIMIIIVAHVKQ